MVLADLWSEADVTSLVDTTVKKFGRLGVNDVGIVDFGSTEASSLTQYDRVIEVSQCTTVPPYDAVRSAAD